MSFPCWLTDPDCEYVGPVEVGPVPDEGRHREHHQAVGDEGGEDDPEEAVEESEVGPPVGDETAVSIQHQQATEVETEEEGVDMNKTDDIATDDESAAERWSQPGALAEDSDPAKEEQAGRAQQAWSSEISICNPYFRGNFLIIIFFF